MLSYRHRSVVVAAAGAGVALSLEECHELARQSQLACRRVCAWVVQDFDRFVVSSGDH